MVDFNKVLAILNVFETSTAAKDLDDLRRNPQFLWAQAQYYSDPITNCVFLSYLEGCITGEQVGRVQQATNDLWAGWKRIDNN